MYIVTPAQMKKIDQTAIEKIGLPGIMLMENASSGIFRRIADFLQNDVCYYSFCIFCGKGNNGGDGFGVARYLYNQGAGVTIFSFADADTVKGDSRINFEICVKLGIEIIFLDDACDHELLRDRTESCDVTIDAIFGTGFSGKLSGKYLAAVSIINEASSYVVSIDIPSGLNGLNGTFYESVFADLTITLGYLKTGLILGDGPSVCGELYLTDIGIPEIASRNLELCCRSIGEMEAALTLPERFIDSHKGNYGKTAVFAGSRLMTGAPVYVIKALEMMGTGLIYYLVDDETHALGNDLYQAVKYETDQMSEKDFAGLDCLVAGPGIGKGRKKAFFDMLDFARVAECPVILDADAINLLAEMELTELDNLFQNFSTPVVLTPHPGEFSRLTRISLEQLRADSLNAASSFSRRWNCVILLKGVTSVIASPDGEVVLNMKGNDSLAKGGSGDVLSGIIGNLLAQTRDPFISAYLGAYILGCAAEEFSADFPSRCCSPERLIDFLQKVIAGLETTRRSYNGS